MAATEAFASSAELFDLKLYCTSTYWFPSRLFSYSRTEENSVVSLGNMNLTSFNLRKVKTSRWSHSIATSGGGKSSLSKRCVELVVSISILVRNLNSV